MPLDERVRPIVLQAGDARASLRNRVEIKLGHDESGVLPARVGQDGAARVDDERVAVGAAVARVGADLRGCQDERPGLDGAGAQQRVPVQPASHDREGGGNRQNGRAGLCQTTVQLREAKICNAAQRITSEPHASERSSRKSVS